MQFSEIKFQYPDTKTYLGSPSIIRLDNGDLLVTHDYFGPGCPKNQENEEHLTSVYRFSDEGKTWFNITHIANAFWSTLFKHNGSMYLFGTSQQYGSIVIRRSDDNGNTWTHPADAKSGLLFQGGFCHAPPNYHTAPVPVIKRKGRIYRAFEDASWSTGFKAFVISADENADLLDASNWIMSNKLSLNPEWVPEEWGKLDAPDWSEGNVVETPNSELWNIMRFNSSPLADKAVILKITDEGRKITCDPGSGFIHFPGGNHKFTIRRDKNTGYYLAFVNNNTVPRYVKQRNILSLSISKDLIRWEVVKTILKDDRDVTSEDSINYTGFQYIDWQFDGDDIIFVSRTAYDGAHTFHDSNRITFHKIKNYLTLLK